MFVSSDLLLFSALLMELAAQSAKGIRYEHEHEHQSEELSLIRFVETVFVLFFSEVSYY